MSNFTRDTAHPETGVVQKAEWLDGYFGGRQYGVRFPDGKVFHEFVVRLGPDEIYTKLKEIVSGDQDN